MIYNGFLVIRFNSSSFQTVDFMECTESSRTGKCYTKVVEHKNRHSVLTLEPNLGVIWRLIDLFNGKPHIYETNIK